MVYSNKIMDHSGSSGIVNFIESQGDVIVDKSFFFQLDEEHDDSCLRQPRKKRQLTANNLHFPVKSFEVEDKPEPDRKLQHATQTDFQTRIVAQCFLKTKPLDKDHGCLNSSHVKLMCDFKYTVRLLTERLLAAEKGMTKTKTYDSQKQIPCIVVGLNASSEVASSTESKVFDSDTSSGNHSSFQEPDEDVPAPDFPNKKMPKRQRRDHEDANNDQASNDVPPPKKLRKTPAEILSDHHLKEPSVDPIAQTLFQQRFVAAKQKTNLSELTYDLLVDVAKRLKKLEDFTSFRSVSKSLHVIVKDEYFEGLRLRQRTPYLMLPVRDDGNNDHVRELYSLVESETTVASLEVPRLKSSTMCCESLGWLLAVQADGSMSLLDPLHNTEIPVPHQHTIPEYDKYASREERLFIRKMVLSARPKETSNFILMVICGRRSSLAFWRSGDEAWNWIDTLRMGGFTDVVYDGGFTDVVYDGGEQFYAIHAHGTIWLINLAAGNVECRIIIDRDPSLRILFDIQKQYILKSIDGSLICIIRTKEKVYYLTDLFLAYEIDKERRTLKEICYLGSMAFFLGRNSSIAVDASKFPTTGGVIKANHIYFTDDFWEFQRIYFEGGNWRRYCGDSQEAKGGCVDSGVFDFDSEVIEPIYPVEPLSSYVCPAMFITPNLSLC